MEHKDVDGHELEHGQLYALGEVVAKFVKTRKGPALVAESVMGDYWLQLTGRYVTVKGQVVGRIDELVPVDGVYRRPGMSPSDGALLAHDAYWRRMAESV